MLQKTVQQDAISMPPALVGQFWAKVDKSGDCWLWTRAKTADGYGVFRPSGRQVYVHRLAYELSVGPIPEGLQIDHLCRVRHCVNPRHLEPVTIRINVLRGVGTAALNAQKTHCLHGHLYDSENTYWYRGSRYCRACKRVRSAQRYALGRHPVRARQAKTRCPQGHPYDAENTRLYRGWRYCRACQRARSRRRSSSAKTDQVN